jgi:hypothetical protein
MTEKQPGKPKVIPGTDAVCPACAANTGLIFRGDKIYFALNTKCPLCVLRFKRLARLNSIE